MSNGDETVCGAIRSALNANNVAFQETDVQNATKFTGRLGSQVASINVYNTGKINVEGKQTDLKSWMTELKDSVESGSGSGSPATRLPAEIEKFPQTLRERVPDCDTVVLWFFQESLRCYKADSPAGAAFMLGAASEKAILVLIDKYASSIIDESIRTKFTSRIEKMKLAEKYAAFKESYKGCNNRAARTPVAYDLDVLLDSAFNFYRHTRNSVGHPQVVPDLDKGIILANLGQFIVYVERIYALIDHFQENGVEI